LPLRGDGSIRELSLSKSAAAIALDHLRSVGLGMGAGPDLLGAQRIRRLSLASGAPADGNGDGRNLDETLTAEIARVAGFAGAVPPAGLRLPMLPWRDGSADLAVRSSAGLERDLELWRTRSSGTRIVKLEDVAASMAGRVQAARALLSRSRNAAFGGSAEEGLLGLLLVEQLLACEEELLRAMSTAGGPLGAFDDPGSYDPQAGLRWWPAELEVIEDAGIVAGYRVRDVASDLGGLAMTMAAAAELAWIASDEQPSPVLRAVFRDVFPTLPAGPPPPPVPSWNGGIRDLMQFRCGNCHLFFGTGGFRVDTLPLLLAGGNRSRALGLPMVVPGNHTASLLWTTLIGPPFPFLRMPPGAPMPATEVAQVADWIDQGALLDSPVVPGPPPPGLRLATIAFQNLVSMHFERSSGALHHRHEGDSRSSVATAATTGRALQALALVVNALPDLEYDGLRAFDVLVAASSFARAQMVTAEGRVVDAVTHTPGAFGLAGLADHAALTAGLLDAARVTGDLAVREAGLRAASAMLTDFLDVETGSFRTDPQHSLARYAPSDIAEVLAALRTAIAAGVANAAPNRDRWLLLLRPALIHAAWSTNNEPAGDGLPDTNGDGIFEPLAAGGEFGRLPVLVGAIVTGDASDAPPADAAISWSRQVRPLLLQKCGACHFGGNAQGNYRCDTLAALVRPGDSRLPSPLLVPGNAAASAFYRKLADRLPAYGAQMPLLLPPLDARGLEVVRSWIDAGASQR
jgi:hypothetical protein